MKKNNFHHNKVSPIYLLPNMITLGAMFCGFYAIIQSISNNFIGAGMGVFFAMILDSLDGRVARLTHTSSPFGAQLDSLADMVGFGVAPAMIAFNWYLHSLGQVGWLFAFIYCACAGLRLARFNTLIGIVDKKYFVGLPSPAAAAVVVGYIYLCSKYEIHHTFFMILGTVITLVVAFSMVSNIRFYSFKEFNFHHRARFRALLIFLLILTLFMIYTDIVVVAFFFLYTFIGYFMYIFRIGYKNKIYIAKDIPEYEQQHTNNNYNRNRKNSNNQHN